MGHDHHEMDKVLNILRHHVGAGSLQERLGTDSVEDDSHRVEVARHVEVAHHVEGVVDGAHMLVVAGHSNHHQNAGLKDSDWIKMTHTCVW